VKKKKLIYEVTPNDPKSVPELSRDFVDRLRMMGGCLYWLALIDAVRAGFICV
jgi:hypothetical protein